MSARDPYPSEKQERFIVRLPDGMRDRIKAAAEANNRSMNAEVVATLEEKYPSPARLEELYAPEIIDWSNRIFAVRKSDKGDKMLEDANKWLVSVGLNETQFVWIRLEDEDERYPATMRKVGDSAEGWLNM